MGNPDFIFRSYDRMAVDHAHELRELLGNKPLVTRICIVSVGVVLHEAQNALLKIFEDPPSNTHFFMVSETDSYLLPTLRSRFFVHRERRVDTQDGEVEKFLTLSLGEKMTKVSEIAEAGTEATRRFMDELERNFSKDIKTYQNVLSKIIEGKRFLLLPSASRKGILESIVCAL
ncbi:MAG: hypothetical protein COV34_02370 [Candidatus Zambryskibacteria bacterium CG10_big_fil_rev_8_21_14_0_10_42_12]|uniref:DNA polymerase III subunit delta n=1 Tax=Candidatus Zambryskibacteria bacterium CG10_big_fil_rev_8_21_14_0_10_42_12 TaxID=1975115 RepID=A0A2H0QUQ1_9BACT|nr:MAG: hypothetical protein COV34_02370 [Candidatus Zambryskibacteria bacterium CG10_big_fil_rev_8_21_14_0_10_42_12]